MGVYTSGESFGESMSHLAERPDWAAHYRREQEQMDRLLPLLVREDADQTSRRVIEHTLYASIQVTRERGTDEDTDRAILQTFWDAIVALKKPVPQ